MCPFLAWAPLASYGNSSPEARMVVAQQQHACKGTVRDAQGSPLVGVSVSVEGRKGGTVTDLDGNFYIPNVPNGSNLIFSYVGFSKQKVQYTGKPLFITLNEDKKTLNEVVVVGYGIQRKVNLSGAVSTVNTKELENRPVLNVGQALQGTVANLNVTIGSGSAVDNPSFNIRGTTSLNGGSPLIVIDGAVSDASTLNSMNPNDIASISVLKDASSSAIYGSRAAFGVILVTTKSGTSEKLVVHYNNDFAFRSNTKMPEIISDPYIVAQWRNTMSYPWYNLYNEEKLAYAKKCSEDPSTSPYYLDPKTGRYTYFGHTDWVKEAYKDNVLSMTHNVDISGKSGMASYYFSGGYQYTDGMIKYGTDTFNRYNTRSKISFQLTPNWTVSNNTSLTFEKYNAPTALNSSYYWEINRLNPLDMVKNPDGSWTSSGASVLGIMDSGGRTKSREANIITTFSTKWDVIKDVLSLNAAFTYNSSNYRDRYSVLPVAYQEGPETTPRYKNETSSAGSSSSYSRHLTFDAYASFHKTIAKKHVLSAVAGFNQESYRYEYTDLSRKELISASLPTLQLATGDKNIGESITTWALRGAYGRLNYTFDNKYIIEFDGRYDGTSRFPHDSRFVFSPSGSAAWVVSQEKFFQPLTDIISFMKIRYSYGRLGNQDVGAYAYIASMGSGKISQILDGSQPVYVSAPGLVSGDLTWEKVTTSNLGLDLYFLKDRLSLSADVYTRSTKDMLTAGQPLPGVLGTSVPRENAANLKTNGWELTIGWKDHSTVAGHPLHYHAEFNIADSKAKITKFANPTGTLSSYYVGYRMGQIWGYTTEGFFTSEEDIANHADQSLVASYLGTRPLAPGDLKFKDLNGDNKISSESYTLDKHGDLSIIGNSSKRYTYGFVAGADWCGFDFSIFLQGVGKKDYSPSGDLYFWGIYAQPWTNLTKGNYVDHWTEETPNAYFPRPKSYVAEGGAEAALTQTKYLQDASYLRLKNLTVGYALPDALVKRLGLSRLRVFFSGDNLAVWSGLYKYYKVDPEGLGGQRYPLQRSWSFGLNITF